jgi:hypothetical protein
MQIQMPKFRCQMNVEVQINIKRQNTILVIK